MVKNHWLFVFIVSMLLTGCAEMIAESNRAQQERDNRMRAELNEALNQRCAGYGFKPGTDAFATCKQTELNNAVRTVERDRADARNREAIRQATTCKNSWGREVPCSSLPTNPKTTNCRNMGGGNYECTTY
jgi:tRNA(Ile)-lysidine synthase TilS/MesJ